MSRPASRTFEIPATERAELLAFIGGTKSDIVE